MKTLKALIFCILFLYPIITVSYSFKLHVRDWLGDSEAQFRLGLKAEMHEENVLKATEYYRRAAGGYHPDAANRLAALLKERGEVPEAIAFHKKAVIWDRRGVFSSDPPTSYERHWGANPNALRFAPLPAVNTSIWYPFDHSFSEDFAISSSSFLKVSSPGLASVFELARLYRTGYHHKDSFTPPNISESDSWYNKAVLIYGVPNAFIGAILADHFGEHREALKWFVTALDQPEYNNFTHYRMGRSYEALGEYTKAVASYKEASQINSDETEAFEVYIVFNTDGEGEDRRVTTGVKGDTRFAALANFRLSELHAKGVPEAGIAKDEKLSAHFRNRAFRLDRRTVSHLTSKKDSGEGVCEAEWQAGSVI